MTNQFKVFYMILNRSKEDLDDLKRSEPWAVEVKVLRKKFRKAEEMRDSEMAPHPLNQEGVYTLFCYFSQ